jgi:hypothetical protein
MCLDKSAHGLVPQHEVFHKPFPVDIAYDTVPTPENYRNRGLKPGEPMKVWHVQTRGHATKGVSPGVVSMGDGFADSPDAEVISGGVNGKTPTAVAIGRQGSFLLWGFSAAPKDMTDSGRLVFLNSVVYAAKFDRTPLLVRNVMDSRDRVPWMIGFIAAAKENYASYLDSAREQNRRLQAARDKAKTAPGEMTERDEFLSKLKDWPEMPYEDFVQQSYQPFPADIAKQFGTEAARYSSWYAENRPYMIEKRRYFHEVDVDAKAVGIANYDPRLLDACVTALEQGKDTERSARILTRYTGERFAQPAEWRTWLNASRSDLFFSDVGGYRFFSKSGTDAAHRRAVRALSLAEPSVANPVSLTVVSRPASAASGETVTVAVRMKIAAGWHTYAEAGTGSPTELTRLEEKLPFGITATGRWRLPESTPQRGGASIYEGDVVFLRTYRLGEVQPGTMALPITVSFQACNRERCLPPGSVTLAAALQVTAGQP